MVITWSEPTATVYALTMTQCDQITQCDQVTFVGNSLYSIRALHLYITVLKL